MNPIIQFLKKDFDISLQGSEIKISTLKNKTILITGGTGFIGSWVTNLIIYLNENYFYNTKLFLIARDYDTSANNTYINQYDYIQFIKHDVRNYLDLPQEIGRAHV